MDESTQSRISDAAAAATRKRRSSILKSQRPPRTPFCELEFNVCTPTDTTKSRRVSFSRRTDVAEFVTNEATTTWKNFYEEHNKSLESSGNDCEANKSRQPIGHLGNRIFDQQFKEVKAVDFMGSINPGLNISSSINNIHFSQQLECTDSKLTAPQSNFELSAFTEQQSKLFGDDLAITCTGEVTDRIDVNFSAVLQIGERDDLDEIQNDLQRQSNVVCHGQFSGGQNLSEYIEIDLNMTHVAIRNDESNMSITDTIHSPKVQDISKSCSIDKKVNANNDWVADKENIAVNPYIAPRESINFAINDESEQVLVFDGKKLIVENEKPKNENYRQALAPVSPEMVRPRKTIVLNCNDDLPNFLEDAQASKNVGIVGVPALKKSLIFDDIVAVTPRSLDETQKKQRTILYDDDLGDISMTQAIPPSLEVEKRRTILYDNDAGNVSVTQAIPSNIVDNKKRRTIVFGNDSENISITQAVPVNVLLSNENEKQKTIVYDKDGDNISVTEALPANIIVSGDTATKRQTFIYEDGIRQVEQAICTVVKKDSNDSQRTLVNKDNISHISITSLKTENSVLPERRRTIVFENDIGNISVTQALPSNIILPQKLNATSYEDDVNISMTQAVPTNILLADNIKPNRQITLVYEDDSANLSITQAVSKNQIIQFHTYEDNTNTLTSNTGFGTNEVIHVNRAVNTKTIVSENNVQDVSMTEDINTNQLLPGSMNKLQENLSKDLPKDVTVNKRQTFVFQNDAADVSITQAVPINQIIDAINLQKQNDDIKPTNVTLHNQDTTNKRQNVVFDNDDADISITQAVNLNKLLLGLSNVEKQNVTHDVFEVATNTALHFENDTKGSRRRTIMYDDNDGDISMTQAMPANIILTKDIQAKIKTIEFKDVDPMLENKDLFTEIDKLTESSQENVDIEVQDVSMTDVNDEEGHRRQTIVYEKDNDMSITQAILVDNLGTKAKQDKIRAVSDEAGNTTLSKPIPAGLSTFQDKMVDKYNIKDVSMLENLTNVVSDVLVYQVGNVSSHKQIEERTETDNSSQPIIVLNVEGIYSTNEATDEIEKHRHLGKLSIEFETPEDEEPDMKSENISAASIIENKDIPTFEMHAIDQKNSILNDLLDMSHSSIEGTDDKNLKTDSDIGPSRVELVQPETKNSMDTLFFITKDSDQEAQTDKLDNENRVLKTQEILDKSPLPIKYKDKEEKPKILQNLQNKISKFKSVLKKDQKSEHINPREKNLNTDEESKGSSEDKLLSKSTKNYEMANDTKELLEMLSDFTDQGISTDPFEDNEEIPKPIMIKGHLALENKAKTSDPAIKRRSFVPKRQSVALSREDMLHSLSMAGAALQKSRYELDESDDIDDTAKETPNVSIRKSMRTSTEVVKTLNFEEEDSFTEVNQSIQCNQTPLKKTAFGEVSYIKDSTSKVIPDYSNISDGIKELMDDLVKPVPDAMPFETSGHEKYVTKSPSTCSTQIQANLLTSSQIDLNTELYSNPDLRYDMNKYSSVDIISDAVNRSLLRAESHVTSKPMARYTASNNSIDVPSDISQVKTVKCSFKSHIKSYEDTSSSRVIIFDHSNPLNNVLLPPASAMDAHRYNPLTIETKSENGESTPVSETGKTNDNENNEKVSTQYHTVTKLDSSPTPNFNFVNADKADTQSLVSNISKPVSIDQSTEPIECDAKDIEVNTVITMKGNMELLEGSSSLTLVDDALVRSNFDLNNLQNTSRSKEEVTPESPVKVIYKVVEIAPHKLDSDTTCNFDLESVKAKKRIYSPTSRDKHSKCTLSSLDITPKPITKMRKYSDDYEYTEDPKITPDKERSPEPDKKKKPQKQSHQKSQKPGTAITVQQLMTMVHVEARQGWKGTLELNTEVLSELQNCTESSVEPRSQTVSQWGDDLRDVPSSLMDTSCPSSKNFKDESPLTSPSTSRIASSKSSRMDWLPESSSSDTTKNQTECYSGDSIITRIDRFLFMGSYECEWELAGREAWSFLLLHGRLRLRVRFPQGVRVCPDTPVLNVALESLHLDRKNPIASLCVSFAAETMRFYVSRGCARADDLPTLVRRLSAVARLAARWARAMHDARARLAYTLAPDGWLALKVANVPLRTVWEVTMQLQLVVEDAQSAPWPRAAAVRVWRVVGAAPPPPGAPRLLAATPGDWGHAPRTVWRIFKYLRNKKRSDDILNLASNST